MTATDKPNVFDVNLSATGRDYAKNREHALFVLDRTGSVGQAEYDEIANAVRSLGRRLMATGQVQVSVVLFAGGAGEENSVWYDGYENMVTHSTNRRTWTGSWCPSLLLLLLITASSMAPSMARTGSRVRRCVERDGA